MCWRCGDLLPSLAHLTNSSALDAWFLIRVSIRLNVYSHYLLVALWLQEECIVGSACMLVPASLDLMDAVMAPERVNEHG